MSEQGVPSDVLVGDHMQVTAALVRLLGSANAALVWTRIEYRARHFAHAHEHAGRAWWQVTARELGDETGLSPDAAERAAKKCVEGGFLLAEQHSLPMQTMSYSPVFLHSAESRIGTVPIGDIADSSPHDRGLQTAESRIAPIAEEVEEAKEASVIAAGFERVFVSWPATRRVRKTAAKSWAKAAATVGAEKFERLVSVAEQHGLRYRTWALSEQTFVPHLTTWLNQERWTTPLPEANRGVKSTTVDHGRDVDAELRRRAAAREQQAVSA